MGENQVEELASGSSAAGPDFDAFVTDRSPRLLRTAWLLCGDRGLAEDLLQTALAATWRRRGELRSGDALESYVRTAMLHTLRSWRRRMSFHEIPVHEIRDEAANLDGSGELRLELVRALELLPLRQRTVIALRYLDDLSEAETAKAMGCSVGTVKSHTFRALRALSRHQALKGLIDMEDVG